MNSIYCLLFAIACNPILLSNADTVQIVKISNELNKIVENGILIDSLLNSAVEVVPPEVPFVAISEPNSTLDEPNLKFFLFNKTNPFDMQDFIVTVNATANRTKSASENELPPEAVVQVVIESDLITDGATRFGLVQVNKTDMFMPDPALPRGEGRSDGDEYKEVSGKEVCARMCKEGNKIFGYLEGAKCHCLCKYWNCRAANTEAVESVRNEPCCTNNSCKKLCGGKGACDDEGHCYCPCRPCDVFQPRPCAYEGDVVMVVAP